MKEEEPATAVIAGGGIVGLTLAMAIKKQLGIFPEVYEKTSTFATEAGAGLGMYPNGLRVLRDISTDLLKDVCEAGHPYRYRRWERHDSVEIMSADESILTGEEDELSSVGIRRSTLQKILYKHAIAHGIKVHFHKALESAVELPDNLVEVTFTDGTKRRTQMLFGADGALGKTRSVVLGEREPSLAYTGVTCLMGLAKIPCDGIYFPSSTKKDFHAVFFPTSAEEQCFQFHTPVPLEEANMLNWGNMTDQVGKEECRIIADQLRAEGWHPKFIEPLNNAIQAVRVGFALLKPRLDRWVKGRIVLVGDAAHPPVPYLGQGAQQGLEDAGVLVSVLRLFCLDETGKYNPSNFDKSVEMYQQIRIERSARVQDISLSLGQMQANRAGQGIQTQLEDDILRGEVLMYGTQPLLTAGASHDYKADVLNATRASTAPKVTTDAALEALDYLLGIVGEVTSKRRSYISVIDDGVNAAINAQYALADDRIATLIAWAVNTLELLLRRIIAHRNALDNCSRSNKEKRASNGKNKKNGVDADDAPHFMLPRISGHGKTVVDEVCEVIDLPDYPAAIPKEENPDEVVLDDEVLIQLKDLVENIAQLYRSNPFHNFEHACNVAVNVFKLISAAASEHHDTTLSIPMAPYQLITSDPLTQLTCVLAALLHDADHEGVPNTQLQKEKPDLATFYKNRALAEQHSVDLAWGVLMQTRYAKLRQTIHSGEKEMKQFRQIFINVIIATDICDKELKEFRSRRWEKAFSTIEETKENVNRKATIDLETLIQVADVSHTMQPWHVYRRWNGRLFEEMYKAYREGRSDNDPSDFWYHGELAFYDFYIIPLARKIKECDILGKFSERSLDQAMKNREEWAIEGEKIVQELVESVQSKWSEYLEKSV